MDSLPSLDTSDESVQFGSRTKEPRNPELRKAIEFLHADRDLLVAAERSDHDSIKALIRKGVNVDQLDVIGRTALHLAVGFGDELTITLLLDAGADTNIRDRVGASPLSLCLMRRPSLKIANMLFAHGAKLLPRETPMDTGLFIQFIMMCSGTKEEEELIKLLVSKGALVDDPNAPGNRQALHFAAMSNNCQMIKILHGLGADLFSTNHRNETPKQVAISFKCLDAAECLEYLEKKRYWDHVRFQRM